MFVVVLLALLLIVYQDLSSRTIHVLLPVVLFLCGLWFLIDSGFPILVLWLNGAFVVLVMAVLVCYMRLRQGFWANPFREYFGLGDLLFYLAVIPYFLPMHYVAFFSGSMLFALLVHKIVYRGKHLGIPLAGYAALLMGLLLGRDLFYPHKWLLV